MVEVNEVVDSQVAAEAERADEEPSADATRRAPPISSRFLFVNVAAQRAKQLRRGALPKLPEYRRDAVGRALSHKPERIAMEEVERGLIPYELPDAKGTVEEAA